MFRSAKDALIVTTVVLTALTVSIASSTFAQQKPKLRPVLMKQFSLTQEDVSFVYDFVHKGWAADGKPTPGSQKFEFDLVQKEMGLKDPPKPEPVYDFSILDELARK